MYSYQSELFPSQMNNCTTSCLLHSNQFNFCICVLSTYIHEVILAESIQVRIYLSKHNCNASISSSNLLIYGKKTDYLWSNWGQLGGFPEHK